MIGSATGVRIGITGLGTNVPPGDDERRTAAFVDTSDEWIPSGPGSGSGGSRRRSEALSDIALPAVREALAEAGADGPRSIS